MQLTLASVLLVFVAVAIAPGEGVKCYECVYPFTSACENPSGDNVKICSGNSCRQVFGGRDGGKIIQRICVSNSDLADKNKCESTNQVVTEVSVCFCKSDLCNNGTFQSVSAVSTSFQSVSVVSMVTSLVLCAVCASWLL